MNKPYTIALRFRDKHEPKSLEVERQRKVKAIMRKNKIESLNKAIMWAIENSYPQEHS